jgi:hypothetical protein
MEGRKSCFACSPGASEQQITRCNGAENCRVIRHKLLLTIFQTLACDYVAGCEGDERRKFVLEEVKLRQSLWPANPRVIIYALTIRDFQTDSKGVDAWGQLRTLSDQSRGTAGGEGGTRLREYVGEQRCMGS